MLVHLETRRPQLEYVWSNIRGILEKCLAKEQYEGAYRELYETQYHLWEWKILQDQATLVSILGSIPRAASSLSDRIRRGLLNLIGILASYVFGTALEELVHKSRSCQSYKMCNRDTQNKISEVVDTVN